MSTYTVRAKRWKHGWELHTDGIGVTQSRNLDGAERMARRRGRTRLSHGPGSTRTSLLLERHCRCQRYLPELARSG
jgi:hypothetical protein